jgi:NTP pyrophosphatase (non-canonical NTP hydrolase)
MIQEIHDNAVSKGWWVNPRSFGELIALIHSEASEALEDFRAGNSPNEVWYEKVIDGQVVRRGVPVDETWKPCGIPSELADIVIRVMDVCGRYGIDLEQAIMEKMAHNRTRPQRHGGKVI